MRARGRMLSPFDRMGTMGVGLRMALTGAAAVFVAGCVVMPVQENPMFVHPDPAVTVENPVWLPLGSEPENYGKVFEQILDVRHPK